MQKKWYKSVLAKDIDAVSGKQVQSRMIIVLNIRRSRIIRQERRQDASHEYCDAGEICFASLELTFADSSHASSVKVRKRTHSFNSLTYDYLVCCHPYLFDGAVSPVIVVFNEFLTFL